MSLLAALLVAAAGARVESISLVAVDSLPALRLGIEGVPGLVSVERAGGVARVSIEATTLGAGFAAGRRFTWSPLSGEPGGSVKGVPGPSRIDVAAETSALLIELALPPDTSLDVRREARGVLLLFRAAAPLAAPRSPVPTASPEPAVPAAPATEARHTTSLPPPPTASTSPATATPAAPPAAPGDSPPAARAAAGASVAELARALFPGTAPATSAEAPESIADLYPRLFPATETRQAQTAAPAAPAAPGAQLGPFRVRAAVDARYVDADTFLDTVPTRDRFLEVAPRVGAEAPVGAGRFTLSYDPVLRSFATYDQINRSSQIAGAGLELPVGTATLNASYHFVGGTVDTRIVDPGGEYFYGLGRFARHDLLAGARVALGPRLSLELSGAAGRVRFSERSSFFDYDSRTASAGFGFELTANLRASAAWVYDEIPRTGARPEAQAQAHSGRLSLSGDLLPLLSGELAFGYRHQRNPGAGRGGQEYSGLAASGALTRRLGHDSLVTLLLSRQTSASAFEANGFYVVTGLQASAQLPLPLALQLRGGLGHQWNDYRTAAVETGRPRRDRLLGWYLGLRRPLPRRLVLSGSYRVENRYSNLDRFDTDSSGFLLQLEWNALGAGE